MILKLSPVGPAVVLLAGLFISCAKHQTVPSKNQPESGDETTEAPHVTQGTKNELIVTLDREAQERLGLTIEPLITTTWNAETEAFGRVLDPAPLAMAVAEVLSANAVAMASRKELERLRVLAQETNASARALENAAAAAERDAVLVATARHRLLADWGPRIAGRTNLAGWVDLLVRGEARIVRVDLPAGVVLGAEPTQARIQPLAAAAPVEVSFLSPAATVDPQTQGLGYLFLAEASCAGLVPGASVTAYLRVDGEAQAGVVVPRAAIVRHEGTAWVYVQQGETNFVRRALLLGPPLKAGWFVGGAVRAGDRVVVTGAQSVFSEELNSSGFMSGERE